MQDQIKYYLLIIALIMALLDWYAVITQKKRLEYLAKPGVLVFILLWFGLKAGFSGPLIWFLLGLFFSLAGDIFLMLPREQFIPGLVSFLMAHIAYIIGFVASQIQINIASLILMVIILIVVGRLIGKIAPALSRSGHRKLIPPVLIYTLAISIMVFSALSTLAGRQWAAGPALLVSGGALLFFISDGLLAWNKFVFPLQYGKIAIIISYHAAQFLISVGVVSHF